MFQSGAGSQDTLLRGLREAVVFDRAEDPLFEYHAA